MKFLICGSGFSLNQLKDRDLSSHKVVAVNNAWKAVNWDYFCCTADYTKDFNKAVGFPSISDEIRNAGRFWNQEVIHHTSSKFGGAMTVGQSVTLVAAYSVLKFHGEETTQIGFIGCDMVYNAPGEEGNTAYYGKGIDFSRRGMSDPDHMDAEARKRNIKFEGVEGEIKPGEALLHYYNRFERIAREDYNIRVVNYSTSESRLPYERETFI